MTNFGMFVLHVSMQVIGSDDFVGAVLTLESLIPQVQHVMSFDFFLATKGTHFYFATSVVIEVNAELALVLE